MNTNPIQSSRYNSLVYNNKNSYYKITIHKNIKKNMSKATN